MSLRQVLALRYPSTEWATLTKQAVISMSDRLTSIITQVCFPFRIL